MRSPVGLRQSRCDLEKEIYDNILKIRVKDFNLNISNPNDYACARLCCMSRCFTVKSAKLVIETFKKLSVETKLVLIQELNNTGLNARGILFYYLPAFLVNILNFEQITLKRGLEMLADLCLMVIIQIEDPNQKGIYTLNIRELADVIAKRPIDIKDLRIKEINESEGIIIFDKVSKY